MLPAPCAVTDGLKVNARAVRYFRSFQYQVVVPDHSQDKQSNVGAYMPSKAQRFAIFQFDLISFIAMYGYWK